MAYPYEIPSFWNGGVRESFQKEDLDKFKREYWKFVVQNADTFIASRTRTMLAASGFSPLGYYPKDYITHYLKENKKDVGQVEITMSNNLNMPLNNELRQRLIQLLSWSTSSDRVLSNVMIFWNFIPIMMLVLFVLLRSKTLKSPLLWISLIVLFRIPLLFMTQPGSYFMYYYPLYLSGIFIVVLYVLEKLTIKKVPSAT
jgi:hypothetical protein